VKEQDAYSSESEYAKQSIGKTSVAPEVLLTIARLTALKVPGVSRMANLPPGSTGCSSAVRAMVSAWN